MLSIWLLADTYNGIAAVLMVLAFTMLIWLSLVLQLGHVNTQPLDREPLNTHPPKTKRFKSMLLKNKLIPFSCFNLIFWLAIVQLGGRHVA